MSERGDVRLVELFVGDALWPSLLSHLEDVGMARHCLDDTQPRPETCYLTAVVDEAVIGHIAIKAQPITVPASYLTHDAPIDLIAHSGEPLRETFVQTFAVTEDRRRCGVGRQLQQAALEKTWALGCHQMRSWSSAEKRINHALKISMGFAIHPALYPMPGGKPLSGVYFVMTNIRHRAMTVV